MIFLVVDTAGSQGGVLLGRVDDDGNVHTLAQQSLQPREFSRELIPAIQAALKAAGLALSQVDAFAAVTGPGSFTGLRVGLGAIKGMAEASGRPVIGVSRLAMVAARGISGLPEDERLGTVHAVLDAGRGEFFHGVYAPETRTLLGEFLETPASIAEKLKSSSDPVFAFEAPVLDALAASGLGRIFPIEPVTAADALPLAVAGWRANSALDPARLDANYVRALYPAVNGHGPTDAAGVR